MTILLWQKPLTQVVRQIVQRDNGAWFDPSDMTTLYQDAAGTIPVTAVEQPVGLVLDNSQGLMLGPELVSNGDFSVDEAGFTAAYQSTIAVSNGRLQVTATGTNPYVQRIISSIAGKYYKITLDIYTGTASKASPTQLAVSSTATLGDSNLFLGAYAGLPYKRYEVIVLSTTNNIYLKVRNGATPIGTYFELDNISVRELKGYHATQSVTASRPTLSARYNLLTKTEDMANSAWIKQAYGTASVPIVTNNYGIAPDGTMTASRIVYALNGGTTTTDRSLFGQSPVYIGSEYTSAVWIKSNTEQSYTLQHRLGVGAQLITADQTWRKYSYTQTITDTTHWLSLRGSQGTSDSADILIWHPDLRVGSTAGPYQRVNTATDYDTDERYFPKYLRFDGIDDYMTLGDAFDIGSKGVSIATSVILFNATKSPIAGKSRAAAEGGRYFLGAEPSAFLLASHDITPSANIGLEAKIGVNTVFTAKLGPHSARYLSLYKNAALINSIGTNLTASSYDTANPFWIGAYPNSSGTTPAHGYLNGGIYGLIITKSALSDAQRIQCERLLARKAGVTL